MRFSRAAKLPMRVPGLPWVGWGPEKGMVYRAVVHECPNCGSVEVGSIDEAREWLRQNAGKPDACWEQVLEGSLGVDQAIWSQAFAEGERTERDRRRGWR